MLKRMSMVRFVDCAVVLKRMSISSMNAVIPQLKFFCFVFVVGEVCGLRCCVLRLAFVLLGYTVYYIVTAALEVSEDYQ